VDEKGTIEFLCRVSYQWCIVGLSIGSRRSCLATIHERDQPINEQCRDTIYQHAFILCEWSASKAATSVWWSITIYFQALNLGLRPVFCGLIITARNVTNGAYILSRTANRVPRRTTACCRLTNVIGMISAICHQDLHRKINQSIIHNSFIHKFKNNQSKRF